MRNLVVMKFGGTSVGSAERISGAAELVAKDPENKVVVSSAMSGVTDMLIKATVVAAEEKAPALHTAITEIREKHTKALGELELPKEIMVKTSNELGHLLDELESNLRAIGAKHACSPEAYDGVVSFGERLSVRLVAAALQKLGVQAKAIDATELIVTSDAHGDAEPDLDASAARTPDVLLPLVEASIVPVVTGFIGQTVDGKTTTLGRGASDYTATILGYCLHAKEVWIWTDVTGVMTADPRLIPEAQTIADLSYEEASELSYFGAKVLHPLTMVPASLKHIPIYIKNTFEPEAVGTRISDVSRGTSAKAITVKNDLSLVTVQGKGVMGVPSVAAKVFGILAAENIDVFLISQASSEHNISFVIKNAGSIAAVQKIQGALASEMDARDIDLVQLRNDINIVAVVGDDMLSLPDITSKTFTAIGTVGVNVIAIAYGSSKHSISFVVEEGEAVQALKSLHHTFQLVERG